MKRISPPRGYFIISRCWTDEVLADLSSLTDSEIKLEIFPGDILNVHHENQNKYIVTLYRTLSTWDGRPVARLVSVSEQTFLKDLTDLY